MRKLKYFFVLAFVVFSFIGCSEGLNDNEAILSKSYAEELGTDTKGSADKHKNIEGSGGEGDFIKNWSNGEITSENKETGDLWSFEAVEGQVYAIFLSDNEDWNHLKCYSGTSKTSFSENPLEGEKKSYYLQDKYNSLYTSPAVVTAQSSGTVYLKVEYPGYETNPEIPYKICVRKGRTGSNYVSLKYYGVPVDAWTEGKLLFAISNGWHDYIKNENSDWVDMYWYTIDAKQGQEYTLFVDGKRDGGKYTSDCEFNIFYYDADHNYTPLFGEDYEYLNNDSYKEGYPFTSPITGQLEFVVWPTDNKPDNLGTYRVAITSDDSYAPLTLETSTYRYQYVTDYAARLAVGSLFNPASDFYLKKYDGSKVNSGITNWGWDSNYMTRWTAYLLCKQEGETYLWAEYDGEYYQCNFKIEVQSERDPQFSITLPAEENCAVGNEVSLKAVSGNTDVTSAVTWYYADASSADNKEVKLTDNKFACEKAGTYYILASHSTYGTVFATMTVLPASSNPYRISVASGSEAIFNSATLKLSKNGSELTNGVVWSTSDEFIDFDSTSHTGTFYQAGTYSVQATHDDVTVTYKGTVTESDVLNITPAIHTKLCSLYGNASDVGSIASLYPEYTVNFTGAFSSSYEAVCSWLKHVSGSIKLNLSGATELTWSAPSGTSNQSCFVKAGISLKSISLSSDLTALPAYALSSCSEVESVTIPATVNSIGKYAFNECSAVTSISLPNVTVVPEHAFEECRLLKTVTISTNATSIGEYAFATCHSLENFEIPSSVTTLGKYAFQECLKLASVTIPAGVTSLPNGIFYNCVSLANITIPSNVNTIYSYAFANCSALRTVEVPVTVKTLGDCVFQKCTSLTSATINSPITMLGVGTFYGCTALTSVTLSNTITLFGGSAFQNCSSLASITLPSSLTIIGASCFSGASKLQTITLPSAVTTLNNNAFENCSNLNSVTLSESLTSIGNFCFYYCVSLSSITIPESVTKIGNYAFSGCTSLNAVYFDYHLSWSHRSNNSTIDTTSSASIINNLVGYEENADKLKSKYASHYWFKDDRIATLEYESVYLTDDTIIPVEQGKSTTLRFYVGNKANLYLISVEEYHNASDLTKTSPMQIWNRTDGKFEIKGPSNDSLYLFDGTTSDEGFGTKDLFAPSKYTNSYVGYHKITISPQSDQTSAGVVFIRVTCINSSTTTNATTYTPKYPTSSNTNYKFYYQTLSITSGNTYAYKFNVTNDYSTYDFKWLDSETDKSNNTKASSSLLSGAVDGIFLIVNPDNSAWWWGDSNFDAASINPSEGGTGYYKLYIWTASPPTRLTESGNVGFRVYKHN